MKKKVGGAFGGRAGRGGGGNAHYELPSLADNYTSLSCFIKPTQIILGTSRALCQGNM